MTPPERTRRDLLVTGLSLLGLLAWDAGGADLAVVRWFGDPHGFGARDSWWAATLLHGAGRWAAWALAAALIAVALRTPRRVGVGAGPGRGERARWLATMLCCALAVPALKQLSPTSCP